MIKNKFKLSQGITLTEIIVVTAIFGAIAVALGNFGSSIFNFNSKAQINLSAQSDGRRVLKTVVAELRSTAPSSLGAYSISQAATSSITFFSNIDDDDYKERIRYFLQGTELKKGVVKPSGNPLTYDLDDEVVITLAHGVVNGAVPIFEYFSQVYAGTSTPLVQPVQVTSVRLVKVTLLLDKDPNKSMGPITVTSQVTLRNLKDNL